jgi:hypothetical protein
MIDNFDDIKKQIKELAPLVNAFKSESVQLRLLELIFQNNIPTEQDNKSIETKTQTKKPKTTKKKASPKPKDVKKTPNVRKKGAGILLNELIEEGFFKTKKTVNEIVTYCTTKKATTVKQGDFTSKLTRYVRDKKLKREKNSDNIYEYYT